MSLRSLAKQPKKHLVEQLIMLTEVEYTHLRQAMGRADWERGRDSRSFTRDHSGVSPVVGCLLMVAITVLLAAALWAALAPATGAIDLPDYAGGDAHTTTPTTNGTPPKDPAGPSLPPEREEKWSVEPLPGYECEPASFGIREYLCVRVA